MESVMASFPIVFPFPKCENFEHQEIFNWEIPGL